jgi:hypothetical protein
VTPGAMRRNPNWGNAIAHYKGDRWKSMWKLQEKSVHLGANSTKSEGSNAIKQKSSTKQMTSDINVKPLFVT